MKIIHITEEQYLKIKGLIDEKNKYHEKITSGWKIRTEQDLNSSRNSAYKLLVP